MREGDRLQEIERERAKARQGTRTDLNIPENLPECSGGQSRDIAAKKLGMSGKCMVCISKFKGYELTPLNSWW
jgi:hypothetical protein